MVSNAVLNSCNSSKSDDHKENKSCKSFSNDSIICAKSKFSPNKAIYYVEEDQILDELDENFKKLQLTFFWL